MILDRTWNKHEQKLIISFINKEGKRDFFTKYLHHIKTYEYDNEGTLDTWNNKHCSRVYKDTTSYSPNEFDMLEFMYEMDPQILNQLHALNFPKLYTFDIETEYIRGQFPEADVAAHKVTAISVVGPDLSCIVFGLHRLNDEKINTFRQRYLKYIEDTPFARELLNSKKFQPKVFYQYYESEEQLLRHFFTKIVPQIAVLAGWNSWRFDWQYLVTRLFKIFPDKEAYNILRQSSPTRELDKISWKEMDGTKHSVKAPRHTSIMDYMELVKSYDYTISPKESFSLDWISSAAFNAHKIPYDGDLQQLYERDPEWYYFYNAVDSLLVMLIHYKLKCLESPAAVSSVTLVPLIKAMGQVALTTANVFEEFYKDGKHVVYNENEVDRVRLPYDGAFCGCVPGRYSWNVCDDFASLYPSQVQTCNFSFENFMENLSEPDSLGRRIKIPWSQEELDKFRKDPNYFVSINGNVYRNDKDYAFKRMQRDKKQKRDKYKYTGQRIDSELVPEIERLISNSSSEKIILSDDINELLKNEFNILDLYSLSIDELNTLLIQIHDKRDEFFMLEIAMKTLGNAAYGAAANEFFYFYNLALAADITGECRHLTKTMIDNLENFFHETIWECKDLWEKFDFALDLTKHDWYRGRHVWIYSDTDSAYTTYGDLFKCFTKEYQEKYKSDNAKRDWILAFNQKFLDGQNLKWCEEIYEPRHGHNIHNFELETISKSGIYLKKKKYIKGLVYSKGKFFDKPKASGTGIEIIKSTTPKLCREILTDLTYMLMFDYDNYSKDEFQILFNQKIKAYKKQFYNAPVEEISQSTGIGNYKKYIINDKDILEWKKGTPISVKAIARFNHLAHKNDEDNLITMSGKIKYYRIRVGKKKDDIDVFGFPSGTLPSWAPPMDKLSQWEKTTIDPINRFLEVMEMDLQQSSDVIQLSLF